MDAYMKKLPKSFIAGAMCVPGIVMMLKDGYRFCDPIFGLFIESFLGVVITAFNSALDFADEKEAFSDFVIVFFMFLANGVIPMGFGFCFVDHQNRVFC